MPVSLHVHEVVALHPSNCLRHCRSALLQPLGDPGAERRDAFLFELIDRPQIHFGGIDQVTHGCHSPLRCAVGGAAIGRVIDQHPADAPMENIATWLPPTDPRSGGYAGISGCVTTGRCGLPWTRAARSSRFSSSTLSCCAPPAKDEGRGCGRHWRRWTPTCVAAAVRG